MVHNGGDLDQLLRVLSERRRFGVKLGLARMERALEQLGAPHRHLRFVHVAGTNGKGSTAAMVEAMARAAGLRTGLFTSPHLCRFSERIQTEGREIDASELKPLLETVLTADPELTFFEATTAVALCHFAEQEVELAVVETGLGGRLDATNVVQPDVCILTSIAMDHAAVLGNDLVSIAAEKAGIVKAGTPCIAARADADVRHVIEDRARSLSAPLWWEQRDFSVSGDGRARYRGPSWSFDALPIPLEGQHQRQNMGLAIACVEQLARAGRAIAARHVMNGLAHLSWPGRLERIGTHLLDCAHNPAAVQALVAALPGEQRYTVIFAALADKPTREMLRLLQSRAARFIFCAPSSSRAEDPQLLARILDGEVAPSPAAGLRWAKEYPEPILITGSSYLVGEVRAQLLAQSRDWEGAWELGDPAVR